MYSSWLRPRRCCQGIDATVVSAKSSPSAFLPCKEAWNGSWRRADGNISSLVEHQQQAVLLDGSGRCLQWWVGIFCSIPGPRSAAETLHDAIPPPTNFFLFRLWMNNNAECTESSPRIGGCIVSTLYTSGGSADPERSIGRRRKIGWCGFFGELLQTKHSKDAEREPNGNGGKLHRASVSSHTQHTRHNGGSATPANRHADDGGGDVCERSCPGGENSCSH